MRSRPLLLQVEPEPGGVKGGPATLDTQGMKRTLVAGWILLLGGLVACAQAGPPPRVLSHSAPSAILWPVEGKVSSTYGSPRGGAGKRHRGIDIRTQPGTPIRASAAGRVSFSGHMRGYGNIVMLEHGGGFETRYAHNRENLVEEGDWVGSGEVVATVGSTGNATAPHVHFEVREHGRPRDPRPLLIRD